VPVLSLIRTRASLGSSGTGSRSTLEMKLSGRSRSLSGICTTTFFGSTATAIMSPLSLDSLINLAMVLAMVQEAEGSSMMRVKCPSVM